jgi:hypothetical protein
LSDFCVEWRFREIYPTGGCFVEIGTAKPGLPGC